MSELELELTEDAVICFSGESLDMRFQYTSAVMRYETIVMWEQRTQ